MLRRILIGLDGSEYSNAAVELGLEWARRFDAVLVGLGIVDEPSICRPEPVPIGSGHYKVEQDQNLLADARRQVEQFHLEFGRRCREASVAFEVLEHVGSPEEQILQQSRQCDVILLGRQTYFHFETQDWPDDTPRMVLRQSSRPVVSVPARLQSGNSVVVAYNGSPEADRALQAFLSLGLGQSERVYVVSIDADHARAAELALQGTDFLKHHDLQAVSCPLEATGAVNDMILAQVQERQARLLVMGAYGHGTWREYLFGSVTNSVLEDCPVPILLSH